MKRFNHFWMLAAAILVGGALLFTSCKEKTETTENAQPSTENVEGDGGYLAAVESYMTDTIGSNYAKGEVCVPCVIVVDTDESNPDDIQVWGDFWVFNYNIDGDTLKTVSGGNHPGLMHLCKGESGYEVTGFDAVGDGSEFTPTAKKIFGDKYDAFLKIQSDEKSREQTRADILADYVKKNGLPVKFYQDYGWPAVALPDSAIVKK